jgi:hypothetical protein
MQALLIIGLCVLAAGLANGASYAGRFVGGIVLAVRTWRARGRAATDAGGPS